mgnify:FL=1|jgi:hypothetical protein
MANTNNKDSFLRRAPTRGLFLDVNDLPKLPKSRADRQYAIEPKYAKRPDLLAHELYGTVQLWWVFALRNPDALVDPIEDFVSGLSIFVPTKETIDRLAN